MTLERVLLRRFVRAAVVGCLALSAVQTFLTLRGEITLGRDYSGSWIFDIWLRDLHQSSALVVTMASCFAVVWGLGAPLRSRVLVPVFAAGYPPARLRRLLLAWALLVTLVVAVLSETASRREAFGAGSVSLWRAGHGWVWRPGRGEDVLLFEVDRLEVVHWPTAGGGESILPVPPRQPDLLVGFTAFRLWQAGVPATTRLAALGHLLYPGLLVFLLAYLPLLVPTDRLWLAPLLALLLIPVSGTVLIWLTVQLWYGEASAVVAAGATGVATIALLVAVERRFAHRGLRTT